MADWQISSRRACEGAVRLRARFPSRVGFPIVVSCAALTFSRLMKIHSLGLSRKIVAAALGAVVMAVVLFGGAVNGARAAAADAEAREILQAAGVKGGVVVHLGAVDGKLTAGLRASPSLQVLGLMFDAAKVPAAREAIQQLGVYGPVSVEFLDGKELPFIDNLVNLLVTEDLRGVAMSEVLRVLVPDGVVQYIEKRHLYRSAS